MKARTSFSLVLLLVAAAALADTNTRVGVLLPIAAYVPVLGANGSLWQSDIVVRNNGTQPAYFFFTFDGAGQLFTEPYAIIQPNSTYTDVTNSPRGSLLLIGAKEPERLVFSARIRDLSRAGETWGTEIPVVPVSSAFASTAHFLNIPSSAEFRVMLRIYDFTAAESRPFTVRVFPVDGTAPLLETTAVTTHVCCYGISEAEVTSLIPPSAPTALRLEVSPASSDPFWAFVSVTNNATQHVTVVTQQP